LNVAGFASIYPTTKRIAASADKGIKLMMFDPNTMLVSNKIP